MLLFQSECHSALSLCYSDVRTGWHFPFQQDLPDTSLLLAPGNPYSTSFTFLPLVV